MDAGELLEVAREAAAAVRGALDSLDDWGPAGTRPDQYRSDLVADDAAVRVLLGAGLGVLSEESGLQYAERPLLAVLDPLDGSTNAARGLPRYATSICVLDDDGPYVAHVADQATGRRYEAVRGGGAFRDGAPLSPTSCIEPQEAMIAFSGGPPRNLAWRQYRALGAAAVDLCAVAEGALDAWVDATVVPGGGADGCWDYMGGLLVCREAGAVVADAAGRELVIRDPSAGRTPVGAATPELLRRILTAIGTP